MAVHLHFKTTGYIMHYKTNIEPCSFSYAPSPFLSAIKSYYQYLTIPIPMPHIQNQLKLRIPLAGGI